MEGYPLFIIILFLALLLIFRIWNGFCSFLGADDAARRNIMASSFSVILLFCAGFGLRLSGDSVIVDVGYFLTELAFLLSYLLIGFAALFGQARYYRSD